MLFHRTFPCLLDLALSSLARPTNNIHVKRVAMMGEGGLSISSSEQDGSSFPPKSTMMASKGVGNPDEHAMHDMGGRPLAMAKDTDESHASPRAAVGINDELDAIPYGSRQRPVDVHDANRDFLNNDLNLGTLFPSLDNYDWTSSHQDQQGQRQTRPGSKRKGSKDDVQGQERKKTRTTSKPLQSMATNQDPMGGSTDSETLVPIENMQPTEEEIIEYTENNTSKTPGEIVDNLASGPKLAANKRLIIKIVNKYLRSRTSPAEDKLILQYYTEISGSKKKDIMEALSKKFPRLGVHRIKYISRYLECFRGDPNEIETIGLPRKDEIEMAVDSLNQKYGVKESITQEEIVNVI
ncbi:hypothetical protein FRB94_007891 [Tulasnella sp. JGI-2019a]|nr:hypothetical protein FRB94_007891 [Tulasnella sp. JGI-2019a]